MLLELRVLFHVLPQIELLRDNLRLLCLRRKKMNKFKHWIDVVEKEVKLKLAIDLNTILVRFSYLDVRLNISFYISASKI